MDIHTIELFIAFISGTLFGLTVMFINYGGHKRTIKALKEI